MRNNCCGVFKGRARFYLVHGRKGFHCFRAKEHPERPRLRAAEHSKASSPIHALLFQRVAAAQVTFQGRSRSSETMWFQKKHKNCGFMLLSFPKYSDLYRGFICNYCMQLRSTFWHRFFLSCLTSRCQRAMCRLLSGRLTLLLF